MRDAVAGVRERRNILDVASIFRPRMEPLTTPDGRYIVVRDRLWRAANPKLAAQQRSALVNKLMTARRQVATATKSGDAKSLKEARAAVHAAKVALGERGPVWWEDGAQDFNRYLVKNTPYAQWHRGAMNRGPVASD